MRWVPQKDIKRCIWMNKWMQHMIHIHCCYHHATIHRRFCSASFNFISDTFFIVKRAETYILSDGGAFMIPKSCFLLVNWCDECDDLPRIRHLIHTHQHFNEMPFGAIFTLFSLSFHTFPVNYFAISWFMDFFRLQYVKFSPLIIVQWISTKWSKCFECMCVKFCDAMDSIEVW